MKLNVVPARAGLSWATSGLRAFLRQPLGLAGLFFLYWTLVFLLIAIPFAGLFIAVAAMPAAFVGYMQATAVADEGRFPMPSALFVAVRDKASRKAFLKLGLAYLVSILAIVLVAWQFVAVDPLDPNAPVSGEALAKVMAQVMASPAVAVASAAQLVANLLFSLAGGLVFWHAVTPMKSIFFATVAMTRNIGAFVVFLAVVAAAVMGVLLVLRVLLEAVGFGQSAAAPLGLLLGAMACSSGWFIFRDSFMADTAPPIPSPSDSPTT